MRGWNFQCVLQAAGYCPQQVGTLEQRNPNDTVNTFLARILLPAPGSFFISCAGLLKGPHTHLDCLWNLFSSEPPSIVGMATSSRSWTSTSPPHFPNVTEEDSHESNFSSGFSFDDVTFCDHANRLLILIGPRAAETSIIFHRQKETTLLTKSRTLPCFFKCGSHFGPWCLFH